MNTPKACVLDALKGPKYPMMDCHVHAVNFVQDTPGFKTLIEYMDRSNITKSVIFGLPVTKQWSKDEREAPEYYLDDDSDCYHYSFTDTIVAEEYRKLDKDSQARIFPLACGFNPSDKYAVKHLERVFHYYPEVFCGIGEIFFRHDDLTLLTEGDLARAHDETIYPILEFAQERNLPVMFHNNISNTYTATYPKYLHELERMLRNFPKGKFVFCHCGISRRVYAPFYKEMVSRLLETYKNLYVDYSWIIFDEVVCPNGIPSPEWIELTERFSDRILLGSDVIGNFHKIGVINHRFEVFLEQLTESTRERLITKNGEKLFIKQK